jgi:hypothetical protein
LEKHVPEIAIVAMRSCCFVAILNKTIGCFCVFFEQNVARTKAKQQ